MLDAAKNPRFPLLLPLRQQLVTSFWVERDVLTVAATRASVRLRADEHVSMLLSEKLPRADVKLSVRAVGRVDALEKHWDWKVSRAYTPGRPLALEFALNGYAFNLKKAALASADYQLYRACLDGDWLGIKLKYGSEPRDFLYTEVRVTLSLHKHC